VRERIVNGLHAHSRVFFEFCYQGRSLTLRRSLAGFQSVALALAVHFEGLRTDLKGLAGFSAPADYVHWRAWRIEEMQLGPWLDGRNDEKVLDFHGLTFPHYLRLVRLHADFSWLLGEDYAAFVDGNLPCDFADTP
jgi:hypothetical protein